MTLYEMLRTPGIICTNLILKDQPSWMPASIPTQYVINDEGEIWTIDSKQAILEQDGRLRVFFLGEELNSETLGEIKIDGNLVWYKKYHFFEKWCYFAEKDGVLREAISHEDIATIEKLR